MKKATFSEYQEAKAGVMKGGECREYADIDEYGRLHKTICCEDGNNFYEVTENGITEFWSTKHSASRKYEEPQEAARDAEENKEDAFVDGMNKVYKQMMTMLEEAGVQPIEAIGKEFDPNLHNAVMQTESEEYESGTVAQELQKGYTYRDSVVRHSMVAVVS